MAFPVDAARVATNITAAADPWTVNLPAGITAGDLLIAHMRCAGSQTVNAPLGWTFGGGSSGDASDDFQRWFYRIADGTEGATQSFDLDAAAKGAAIVWRITGVDTSIAPSWSGDSIGTSTTPNPGSLTPAGGAKDYLWLWLGGWEGEQTSPPAGAPTNYTNAIGANSGTAGVVATNCRVAGASRQLNAATEDPPSWTISASDDWIAWTLAIHPAPPLVDADAEVSFAELEVPLLNAAAEVSWAELEVPTADAAAEVSWAELEVPTANADSEVSFAELEVPDFVAIVDADAEVAFAELETPFANADAEVSWAELEVPTANADAEVSWAELEVPFAQADAELSFAEFETPIADARADVSWAELEVPTADSDAELAFAELEVPDFSAGGGPTGSHPFIRQHD